MSILDFFISKAQESDNTIAIGLGDQLQTNQQIILAAQKVAMNTKGRILLVGHPQAIKGEKGIISELPENIDVLWVSDPSIYLLDSIFTPKTIEIEGKPIIKQINAIIRGGLSSDYFLKKLRNRTERKAKEMNDTEKISNLTYRAALLETSEKYQFFYAPVGIDEGNTFLDKKNIIDYTIPFLKKLNLTPKIAILSGGRLSDIGRDPWIDQNIEEAENLTRKLQKDYPELEIKHMQILIEKAISEQNNFILAPEGIAGNLIYRTLVHLGAGKSYGALYLSQYYDDKKIIIDTSRTAPANEYEGAMYMALAIGTL